MKRSKRGELRKDLRAHYSLYLMFVPGLLLLLAFNYLPMFGIIIAFKNVNYTDGIFGSPWVGFANFEYLFKTQDAYTIIRNTVLYNLLFIVLGLTVTVTLAICLFELWNKKWAKFYQTAMFLPFILSWVVVSYVVYAFLSPEHGFINKVILEPLGYDPVFWYQESKYWPYILTFFNLWKYTGNGVVVYLAALSGIDPSYYEAASIDGASKWRQIRYITIPMLAPLMIILTILSLGRIFSADFGLFFNVTLNQGLIRNTTAVLDTYVYNSLMTLGDIGMASAASFFQSVVGFVLILSVNHFVRKINKDNALF
ncbi:sugar ABC transporter permease [Paenibacillus swuensis]|uniref:Sugar ABC transporter permease n=1 Tax=Paenibacillus swuensis TaxID=1178515 RepID=A0A172TPB8_9BACL|nr:sugar ABC transporter permease [Paenibacillus swuensis]